MARLWSQLPPTLRKLLWFVALWGAGVLTVTVVAFGIRSMIL